MYFAAYEPDNHGTPLAGVAVRPAEPGDLPAAAELMALREGCPVEEWHRRLEFFGELGDLLVVAEHAGTIVGYGRLAHQTPVAHGGRGVPDGLYLSGMIVHPQYRRRGIGRALTQARCEWAWQRGERVFFVVNAQNQASMDLHRELGFREVTRDFDYPGITFAGGEGVLFAASATSRAEQVTALRPSVSATNPPPRSRRSPAPR